MNNKISNSTSSWEKICKGIEESRCKTCILSRSPITDQYVNHFLFWKSYLSVCFLSNIPSQKDLVSVNQCCLNRKPHGFKNSFRNILTQLDFRKLQLLEQGWGDVNTVPNILSDAYTRSDFYVDVSAWLDFTSMLCWVVIWHLNFLMIIQRWLQFCNLYWQGQVLFSNITADCRCNGSYYYCFSCLCFFPQSLQKTLEN